MLICLRLWRTSFCRGTSLSTRVPLATSILGAIILLLYSKFWHLKPPTLPFQIVALEVFLLHIDSASPLILPCGHRSPPPHLAIFSEDLLRLLCYWSIRLLIRLQTWIFAPKLKHLTGYCHICAHSQVKSFEFVRKQRLWPEGPRPIVESITREQGQRTLRAHSRKEKC